ncbi:HAD hydrolase-like protein [Pontiellaceae bacterium B12219]|nr:HAD hydrolase-like protein [Pontiellaceae bacterium B12219]
MNILFWVPPWPSNGEYDFFRNCTRKHLIPQANLLSEAGVSVSFVLPEFFRNEIKHLHAGIKPVILPFEFGKDLGQSDARAYVSLYLEDDSVFIENIQKRLESYLDESYDAILLWETPVPFLERMFTDAVIVHQMPGIFSRAPYPHTVIFDPVGLFRKGMLHRHAKEVQEFEGEVSSKDLVFDFSSRVRAHIDEQQVIDPSFIASLEKWEKVSLLPLQVTGHYAFLANSGYESQMDLLLDVLQNSEENEGVVVTQYVSNIAKDAPLNLDVLESLSDRFPNLIYNPDLEKINSVSQFLLPFVGEVKTVSSSLGLQSFAWKRRLATYGTSYLDEYDYNELQGSSLTWADVTENTLKFILSKHQPLAHSVTADSSFLVNLLKEMIVRKQSGCSGIELLPDFGSIDHDYASKLLGGFRLTHEARRKSNTCEWSASHKILNEFKDRLDSGDIEAVSFDVFDTLIRRPVEKPADVYKFLELRALEVTDGVAVDFGKNRALCEVATRERLPAKKEISLEDIYETVREFYGLTDAQLAALKDEEVKIELAFSSCRDFGKKLYNLAIESRLPVYLISDMYLPRKVIEEMLRKSGYTSHGAFFLSAEHECRKHDGGLYDIALRELNLRPKSLLHVGDNKQTDINAAKVKGISTFRWSSAIEWMRTNAHYKNIYSPRAGAGEKARSAIAGLIANHLFDAPVPKEALASLFRGRADLLGFSGLGPLVIAYVIWLEREARRDNISHLFFMAREGWIFHEVYKELFGNREDAIRSTYLYGSRRAIRVAGLKNRADILALSAMPYDPGVSLAALLDGRYGLALTPERIDRLKVVGIRDVNSKLSRSYEDRRLIATACDALEHDILENAAIERSAYLEYLDEVGFLGCDDPGIVDIGWKANIQGALGLLIDRRLTGYYYATLQDGEKWEVLGDRHRCYFGKNLSQALTSSVVVQNRHLTEYLLCCGEPSFVRMRDREGQRSPEFRFDPDGANRTRFIGLVHDGIIRFSREYKRHFGRFSEQIHIDPSLAESCLRYFYEKPAKCDAEMLLGKSFEDSMGGIQKKYIINPEQKDTLSSSVWKKGAEAVFNGKQTHKSSKPKNPKRKSRTVPPDSTAQVSPIPGNTARVNPLEDFFVRRFVNDRKYNKYKKDRDLFFKDSRSSIMKSYYRLSTQS